MIFGGNRHKRLLIGLPILAVSLIFFGLWIAEKISGPPWRSELHQYMAFKASLFTHPITIQRTLQASQPWQFTAEMSGESFGDCFYFRPSLCYKPEEIYSTPSLPYPPDELWCALLKASTTDTETGWVVYVAKYEDLYNADWVVHESNRDLANPLLTDDLSTVGCERLLTPTK